MKYLDEHTIPISFSKYIDINKQLTLHDIDEFFTNLLNVKHPYTNELIPKNPSTNEFDKSVEK